MAPNLTRHLATGRSAARSFRKIVYACGLSLLLPACAKVGDPLPPIVVPPQAVETIRVVQTGGASVTLVFSLPHSSPRELRVYRSCGEPLDPALTLRPLAVLTFGKGREPDPASPFEFQDPAPVLSANCQYAVVVVDRKGRSSPPSQMASTLPEAAALPPDGLTAEVKPDGIHLSWKVPQQSIDGSAVKSIEGYLVNSEHFVSANEYVDTDARFGEAVTYWVQTVTRRESPTILSTPSTALAVVRKDTFPPSVPVNLSAIFVLDGVELLWDASEEPDLAGFFVYRGPSEEELRKLSPLITINRFADNSVSKGQALYYAVSALDTNGNESSLSEAVRVMIGP